MILLADRNVLSHKILAQGQELTNEIGSVGGEQNITAAKLNFLKEITFSYQQSSWESVRWSDFNTTGLSFNLL